VIFVAKELAGVDDALPDCLRCTSHIRFQQPRR
jgi:hypothetical protein